MLKIKLLVATAKPPTVAHPGEDLGYDVYSAVTVTIGAHNHAVVSVGIALEITDLDRFHSHLQVGKGQNSRNRCLI